MGVPKFYRWLSERYPKINQVVTDTALLPEFDHLYLDMNGIIHGCTHPNHMDITANGLSERDMMLGIMHYLDRIITQIVKPKVSVFLAIDGVAPRAKLNQQRSRRFRSAKDLLASLEEKNKDNNEESKIQRGDVFDSNCITPGTEFMDRVSAVIEYWIRDKLRTDPLWQNLHAVVFSGPDVPGEGEHKIMQHLREMKSNPNYPPNSRHVMYGQDADLIMLGLVSHEPHFTLLREIVNFGMPNNNRGTNAVKTVKRFTQESDFQLLHLSVLREYIQLEFCSAKEKKYDLERVVDDFVFLTFLVGNDFLPHLPALDIGDGAFDLLFRTYREKRSSWKEGDYLVHCGEICDASRLEAFLYEIGKHETELLQQKEEDDATYTAKKRRWNKRDFGTTDIDGMPSDAELKKSEATKDSNYRSMLGRLWKETNGDESMYATFGDNGSSNVENVCKKPLAKGEKDYKGRYYFEKLRFTPIQKQEHQALRQSYYEGLLWCLAYYFKGCVSWGWFFPYHYGPMLSDMLDLSSFDIQFELGKPLLPYEQLMGCLPPASSSLLPQPYRRLMMNPDSPILQFYPTDFVVDMNGKRNPWEGVNLLPFIDVNLLKNTLQEKIPPSALSVPERNRNKFGDVRLYAYDPTNMTEVVPAPKTQTNLGLSDLTAVKSSVRKVHDTSYQSPPKICFQPQLVPGTKIPYPGFPSLHVLPIASTELTPVGLNCFGFPSKYPNCILTLHTLPQLPDLNNLAANVLGKSLYINYPMMHEAKVVAISNETGEVRSVMESKVKGGNNNKQKKKNNNNKGNNKNNNNKLVPAIKTTKFTSKQQQAWLEECEKMKSEYWTGNGTPGSGGIIIGDIPYRLLVLPLQGMKTNASHGGTKKVWGTSEADVPLQVALWQAPAQDPRFVERPANKNSLEERFPMDSKVVFTQGKYKGCNGEVVGIHGDTKTVGVRTNPNLALKEPPFAYTIAQAVKQHERYFSSSEASQLLKLPVVLFGKLMGSLVVDGPGTSRYDIGLNIKYPEGLYVVGYTRAKNNTNDDSKKKTPSNKSAAAWTAGDTLKVVGSVTTITPPSSNNNRNNTRNNNADNNNDAKIIWEYSPRAIRLVHMYRQEFPQVFKFLASQRAQERKYDASVLVRGGGKNNNILDNVHKWLSKSETASLPRTPISTKALPKEAIQAIQRAASIVSNSNSMGSSEVLVKVPPAALYRCGSTTAVTHVDFNNSTGGGEPALGDRIVNICANGIPFGYKGTVVGIHAPETGCVEVVMDQEFVGGGNLQGACDNFRGKLCLWKHIMKVSTNTNKSSGSKDDNTTTKTDNEVNTILVTMMEQLETSTQTPTKPKNAWGVNTAVRSSKQEQEKNNNNQNDVSAITNTNITNAINNNNMSPPPSGMIMSTPHRPNSTGRPRSAGRPRSNGRPVTWREAVKPKSNESIGFRGPHRRRGAKPGYERWKAMVKQSSSSSSSPMKHDVNSSNQLRAMLGVTGSSNITSYNQNEPNYNNNNSRVAAEDGLKALLGVAPISSSTPMKAQQQAVPILPPGMVTNATAAASNGIMPLLPPPNVSASPMQMQPPPPPPQQPIMMHHQMPQPPMPPPPPHHFMMPSPPPPPPPHFMMQSPPQQEANSSSSAADRLFKMMQQQNPPPTNTNFASPPPPPHPSTFNFTYVEEKKKNDNPLL